MRESVYELDIEGVVIWLVAKQRVAYWGMAKGEGREHENSSHFNTFMQ